VSLLHGFCAWTGLLLVLAGSLLAGQSLYRTWTQHGDGPLLPRVARGLRSMRTRLARFLPFLRKSSTVHTGSGGARVSVVDTCTATGHVVISEGATTDEKVELLVQQVEGLRNEIRSERKSRQAAVSDTHTRIHELRKANESSTANLKVLARDIAVGELRRQLAALLLVAFGTALLAVPTLFPAS